MNSQDSPGPGRASPITISAPASSRGFIPLTARSAASGHIPGSRICRGRSVGLPTLPASYRAGKERKTYLLCVLTTGIVMLGTRETIRASEGLLPKGLTISFPQLPVNCGLLESGSTRLAHPHNYNAVAIEETTQKPYKTILLSSCARFHLTLRLLKLPVMELQIYASRTRQHFLHDSELRMP